MVAGANPQRSHRGGIGAIGGVDGGGVAVGSHRCWVAAFCHASLILSSVGRTHRPRLSLERQRVGVNPRLKAAALASSTTSSRRILDIRYASGVDEG